MQTQTDLTARLGALHATLAKATMACWCPVAIHYAPEPESQERVAETRDTCSPECGGWHGACCVCQGTGEVARFPGFRQECGHDQKHQLPHGAPAGSRGYWYCPDCQAQAHLERGEAREPIWTGGRRWQVRARGMEDALAGLSVSEAVEWKNLFSDWLNSLIKPPGPKVWTDPMPDRDAILAKTLELVIEAAGLEVPDVDL